MSNRARRAHTHRLRRRLLPRPRGLLQITLRLHGAEHVRHQIATAQRQIEGMR